MSVLGLVIRMTLALTASALLGGCATRYPFNQPDWPDHIL